MNAPGLFPLVGNSRESFKRRLEHVLAGVRIAPKVGGVTDSAGKKIMAEMALSGSPSIMFDAVAVLAGPAGDKSLSAEPDAISFLMDADRHLKAIAIAGLSNLAKKTHVEGVVGVTDLRASGDISKFIDFARNGKVWERDSA